MTITNENIMKVKSIKAVQINKDNTCVAAIHGKFYVVNSDGMFIYNANEIEEVYNVSSEDLKNKFNEEKPN